MEKFPLLDGGIPDFSMNGSFYDGSLMQQLPQTLLQQMDQVGWRKAIKQVGKTLPSEKQHSFVRNLRENRVGWKYLLDISNDKRVLDFGCGLGAISIALAREFGEVVGFDLTAERLIFAKNWSEQAGLKNMAFVKGGNTPFLPFPEQYFDTVVLNDVLEWIPESRKGEPKKIQVDFLREIYRVLKANGEIYIGVENRFSYEYFLGRKDPRSLAFASLVPRSLANLYSLVVRGKPYRTYTHSIWGYKDLLRKAGFKHSRFFLPYPTYKELSQIVNVASGRKMNARLMAGQGGYGRSAYFFDKQLLKFFAPFFSITVSKGIPSQCFLERVVDQVFQKINAQKGTCWTGQIKHFLISSGKVSVVIDDATGTQSEMPRVIIKIPLTPYSHQRLARNARTLQGIRSVKSIASSVAEYTPRSILWGDFVGQTYFVEELMPGVCGERLMLSLASKRRLMKSAAEILTKFHTASLTSTLVDEAIFKELFIKPILEVADFVEYEKERETLIRITSTLRKMVLGTRLPLVWSHGDFSLKNVTVNSGTLQISGLIDWDLSRKRSLPLVDLLHLIARERMVEENVTLRGVFFKYLFPLSLAGIQDDILADYAETLSIDRSVMPALCIMYWISRIHGHIGSLNDLDVGWVNENFVEVAEGLSQNL